MELKPGDEVVAEELDFATVVASLQSTIGAQAFEIAKAQAMIANRNQTITAQQLVIENLEERLADSPSDNVAITKKEKRQ